MNQLLNVIAFFQLRVLEIRDAAKDRGATATEYAMLVAVLIVLIAAGVTVFGNDLAGVFDNLTKTAGLTN